MTVSSSSIAAAQAKAGAAPVAGARALSNDAGGAGFAGLLREQWSGSNAARQPSATPASVPTPTAGGGAAERLGTLAQETATRERSAAARAALHAPPRPMASTPTARPASTSPASNAGPARHVDDDRPAASQAPATAAHKSSDVDASATESSEAPTAETAGQRAAHETARKAGAAAAKARSGAAAAGEENGATSASDTEPTSAAGASGEPALAAAPVPGQGEAAAVVAGAWMAAGVLKPEGAASRQGPDAGRGDTGAEDGGDTTAGAALGTPARAGSPAAEDLAGVHDKRTPAAASAGASFSGELAAAGRADRERLSAGEGAQPGAVAGLDGLSTLAWSAGLATGTETAATAAPVESVDIGPAVQDEGFADEVSLQVSTLARKGTEQATLHLNPAEMGPVEVSIRLEGDQATVGFKAAREDTREALTASLGDLGRQFQADGLVLADAWVAPTEASASAGEDRSDGAGNPGASNGAGAGDARGGAGGDRREPGGGQGASPREPQPSAARPNGVRSWDLQVRASDGRILDQVERRSGERGRLDLYA